MTLPTHQARTVTVNPRPGSQADVRVVFGSGRIHGRVYDEFGDTRAGARVRLSTVVAQGEDGRWGTSAEGDRFEMSTTTDDAGRYEFRDLPVGTFYLVGKLATEASSGARDIRSFKVTLAVGEVRELDLGEPIEDGRWVGQVQYANGTRPRASGSIFLQHRDGSRRMYVKFDDEGRFSEQVPSGTWRMEYVFSMPDHLRMLGMFRVVQSLQELTVRAGEARVDAIIPGARVEGAWRGTTHAMATRRSARR